MMVKILKWFLLVIVLLALMLVGFFVYVSLSFKDVERKYPGRKYLAERISPRLTRIGNNWLREEQPGLYTLYVEGKPYDRGLIAGVLTRNLIYRQEKAFLDQIMKIVPSKTYLNFLKYVVGAFDFNLYGAIPEERKAEIYGVSQSASPVFDNIGTRYQRLLNYHGAHDLGHMLSNLGMVGCTSFGVWGQKSGSGNLLIGRNFDFYVGDEFAREKIVAFIRPDSGFFHAFVTWGGMMGAVSGMNEKGLTVTINAANSDVVIKAATPVSLVAREILQYASNIDEAVKIAGRFDVFVSELFLIGSVADNEAVIIEKRPGSQVVYSSHQNYIISTNHFQSRQEGYSAKAVKQRLTTASGSRYLRVNELINGFAGLGIPDLVSILRDTSGNGGVSIGLGNELTINQLIGHHSIIFDPVNLRFWVSTSPYQVGKFVCYDLTREGGITKEKSSEGLISEKDSISADTSFLKSAYPRYKQYLELRRKIMEHHSTDQDAAMIVRLNPRYYEAWEQAGDHFLFTGNKGRAKVRYNHALTLCMPGEKETRRILKRLSECE